MNIAVVIPVFNEKKHIKKLLSSLYKHKLPIIVVDDGSNDGSLEELMNKKIILLRHKINLGKGAAMKTGANYAFSKKTEAIIFLDSDNQHDPLDLKIFIQKLKLSKYDAVFGVRGFSKHTPFVRRLGTRFASNLMRLMYGINISDPLCGYRAITKSAYSKLKWDSLGYGVELEVIAKVAKKNLKFIQIPVKTIYNDKDKGVTVLDVFGVLGSAIKQWLS